MDKYITLRMELLINPQRISMLLFLIDNNRIRQYLIAQQKLNNKMKQTLSKSFQSL